jgi:hypothetical protein
MNLYDRQSFLVESIFSALCERPYGLTNAELCDHAYAERKEPPLWAEACVGSAVMRFNNYAKENRLGLRIRGLGGPGSKYLIYVAREK